MKKVLITGGLGLIGSSIAKKIINDGYEVIIIDNKSTNITSTIDGTEIIEADITKNDALEGIKLSHVDTMLHLAGQSSGPKSYEEPYQDVRDNVLGTINALRFCGANNIRRIVFASSFAVYGDPVGKEIFTEEDSCNPLSVYGTSKYACEKYIKILSKKFNLTYDMLRMFNVYGPGQDLGRKDQGIVSIFLSYVREGNYIPVMGSLKRFRDLVYIDDVVDGWIACLKNEKSKNEIYNLGSGKKSYVGDLIEKLIQVEGKKGMVKVEEVGVTPGDLMGSYADMSKMKRSLGFTAQTNLDEGLLRFKKWADETSPITD